MIGSLPRLIAPAAVVTLLAFGLTSCGSDSTTRITRVSAAPVSQERDGRLVHVPAPLALTDLTRFRAGSPQQTVMTLWFYGQWGDTPAVYEMYDAVVRHSVTPSAIMAAYSDQRSFMLASLPRITSVSTTSLGTLVTVELLTATANPQPASYLLERSGKQWVVLYDTFLEQAIAAYAQSEAQEATNASATQPSPKAVAAGAQAASAFRSAVISAQSGSLR